MQTTSQSRWVVLTRGQLYHSKEYGLSFERGVPKEVPSDVAAALKHTGSFLITDEAGNPIVADAPEAVSAVDTFVLPPPVFNAAPPVLELAGGPPRKTKNNIDAGDDLNDKDILLRRFGGIGDVVFVAHVAQEIKRRWPKARVRLAVNPQFTQFAEMFDAVDSAMTVDESCTYQIVSQQDYVIPFHNVIEKNHEYHSDFFDAHWKRAGLDDKAPTTLPLLRVNRIGLNPDAQKAATKFLHDRGIGEFPYIVVVVGTAGPLKMYSPEHMKIVAETLARTSETSPGIPILCLGSHQQILDRPFKPSPELQSRITFAMDLPLEVSAELVRRSRVTIGTDTGLVQFAASIGVPTVSLWGPISPSFSIEHYPSPGVILTAQGVECSPCGTLRLARCGYYKADGAACMKSIKPDDIAAYALRLFNAHEKHDASVLDTSALTVGGERVHVHRNADNVRVRVAVLLDNGSMHSGGGHYLWRIACTMAHDPELDVTVFTDVGGDFVYESNGAPVKIQFDSFTYERGYAHVHGLDASFDVVIAGPPHMGETVSAWKNGIRPDGVTILAVYETPGLIATHRKGADTSEDFWRPYKAALLACDYVWCISKPVRDAFMLWDPQFADKHTTTVDLVYPAVNTQTADLVIGGEPVFSPATRDDVVVMIGRKMTYKRMAETAAALMTGPLAERALRLARTQKLLIIGDDVDKGLRDRLPVLAGVELELRTNVREHDKFYALHRAKCVVHPSDLEGFGIVIAEAMYCGAPVAVQALPEYAASFASHTHNFATDDELCRTVATLMDAYDNEVTMDTLADYVNDARTFVTSRYTIPALSKRLRTIFGVRKKLKAVKEAAAKRAANERLSTATKNLRVAIVSPWGTQCGIAETTKHVADHYTSTYRVFAARENETATAFDDARSVRCWDRSFDSTRELQDELLRFQPHIVHFHHEFSFYRNEQRFLALIASLRALGIKVVVTAHTYAPSAYMDTLAESVDKLVFTKPLEGAPDNHVTIALPVTNKFVRMNKIDARRKLNFPQPYEGLFVGSIGMWVPHKGYGEFVSTLNDVSLRCGADTRYVIAGYSNPRTPYMSRVVEIHRPLFDSKRVIRACDFMSDEKLFTYASACDVLVYNYSVEGHFSSSAAIRDGMAAGRPVITTHSPMFSEFEDQKHVVKVPFGALQTLTNAICGLYGDSVLSSQLVYNCDAYLKECTPEHIARQYEDLYLSLVV